MLDCWCIIPAIIITLLVIIIICCFTTGGRKDTGTNKITKSQIPDVKKKERIMKPGLENNKTPYDHIIAGGNFTEMSFEGDFNMEQNPRAQTDKPISFTVPDIYYAD